MVALPMGASQIFTLVLVVVGTAVATVKSEAVTNLLTNPSFEDELKGSWKGQGLSRYQNDKLHGQYSLKCSSKKISGPTQTVLGMVPGRSYAFQGYVKLLNEDRHKLWQNVKVSLQFGEKKDREKNKKMSCKGLKGAEKKKCRTQKKALRKKRKEERRMKRLRKKNKKKKTRKRKKQRGKKGKKHRVKRQTGPTEMAAENKEFGDRSTLERNTESVSRAVNWGREQETMTSKTTSAARTGRRVRTSRGRGRRSSGKTYRMHAVRLAA